MNLRCRFVAASVLGLLLLPSAVEAQRLVFVVRHAERADGGAPPSGMTAPADPDLSPAGHARAERLADMLSRAGVTKIVVTEFKRTQQTAAPLAARLRLTPVRTSSKDVQGLVTQLAGDTNDVVLIVGHNTTVPAIIAALGGPTVTIPETDYGNLFVFVPATHTVATLRY